MIGKKQVAFVALSFLGFIVAYLNNNLKEFIVIYVAILLAIVITTLLKGKISIMHPVMYSIIEKTSIHVANLALIVYLLLESIPPDYKIYGISLRKIFISFIVLVISAKISSYIEEAIASTKTKDGHKNIIMAKGTKYLFITLVLIVLLKYVNAGNEVKNLIIGAGFLSIVIGLAAQSTLSNVIAGLLIISEKPFSVGDSIEVNGIIGEVVDIKLMSTYVKTIDNKLVRIPNSKLFENDIVNYKKNKIITIRDTLSISYSSDVNKAIEVILKTLDNTWFVLKYPSPYVSVKALGDSGVILEVWYTTVPENFMKKREEVLKNVYTELQKNEIEIPYPQVVNWFANDLKISFKKEK